MNFLLPTIFSHLVLYKYGFLYFITASAAFIAPIPASATIMAASALASLGSFNLSAVFLVSVAGNLTGDNLGYWLARYYGKPVLYKIGFRKILDSQLMIALERHINKRPGKILVFSRFEVIATISANLVSGLGKMPYRRFFTYDVLGEVAQVAVYGGFGYLVGSNWLYVVNLIGDLWLLLTPLIILAIFLYWKNIIRWIIEHD